MTSDDYCTDKTVPSGSDMYYSVLFLAPERRRTTIVLETTRREPGDAARDASDPAVIQSKLQWWRQELARLFEGRPEHPAAKALQPRLARYDIDAAHLDELLAGVEAGVTQDRYLDRSNLCRHDGQVMDMAGRLMARIVGQTHARTLEFARLVTLVEQFVHLIRSPGGGVRHNRIYIPVDGLQRLSVPVTDLFSRQYAEGFKPLMIFQVERARVTYKETPAVLPVEDRHAQRSALTRDVFVTHLLGGVETDDFQVLTQHMDLMSLYRLQLAWKTQIRV